MQMLITAILSATLISTSTPETASSTMAPLASASEPISPILDSTGLSLPEDEVQIDVLEIEADSNNGMITYHFPENSRLTRDAWGASFATSTEFSWFFYQGIAYAGANVYQGQRIVQVCIWYTQGGRRASDTVCSTASSDSGVWLPTDIAAVSTFDTLEWNAPHTMFNIRTSRISPYVI
jgi:hypothetical protein